MVSEDTVKELVDIFEDAYDKKSTAKELTKEATTMIKDYCEREELNPKDVKKVFKDYEAWRKGELKWVNGSEDSEYVELQISVMDHVTSGIKEDE